QRLADATRGRHQRSGHQPADRVRYGSRCRRCTSYSGLNTNTKMRMTITEEFTPLFAPKTVAVVGASTKGNALPSIFIRRIGGFGFAGDMYLILPAAGEIDGLMAYTTLAETPKPVVYAYTAVSGAQISAMLSAAKRHVRFAQVVSS